MLKQFEKHLLRGDLETQDETVTTDTNPTSTSTCTHPIPRSPSSRRLRRESRAQAPAGAAAYRRRSAKRPAMRSMRSHTRCLICEGMSSSVRPCEDILKPLEGKNTLINRKASCPLLTQEDKNVHRIPCGPSPWRLRRESRAQAPAGAAPPATRMRGGRPFDT